MDRRRKLQQILMNILGSNNVYFQPPPTIKLKYPCIIYQRTSGDTNFADNSPYNFHIRYKITLICREPEQKILEKIASLPMCKYDRFYTSDNLNHDVFNIYF